MEYFLGSIITILSFIIVNWAISKKININIPIPIFSQSRKYYLISAYISNKKRQVAKTQSKNKIKRNSVRGIVFDNNVYWIENGFLVTANLINGKVDENSKKRVDTYSMDKVQLNRISFIVEKLAEGKRNDTGNTGNKDF